MSSKALFDDDDDDDVADANSGSEEAPEEFGSFKVNKGYADRFERRKQKQELARLRERHGSDDDDDESTEDEDGELLTPALDVEIFQTIDKIRNKRPEIYTKDARFFSEEPAGDESDEEADGEEAVTAANDADAAPATRRRPLTVKQQLLEQGAAALASDDDSDDDDSGRRARRAGGMNLAYDAEQRELRKAFIQEATDEGAADEEEASAAAGGLRRKAKSSEQREVEERDYSEFLRHQLSNEHKEGAVDDSVTLRRYMFGEQLNQDERFLRDYVLNAMWKGGAASRNGHDDEDGDGDDDRGGGAGGAGGAGDAGVGTAEEGDDEDAFSDRADDFERQHNFRFEEAGAAQVTHHPRHDPNSVRRQTALGRKKEAEEAKKARKAEARAQKEAELKRLKNLKKQEILDRLRQIEKARPRLLSPPTTRPWPTLAPTNQPSHSRSRYYSPPTHEPASRRALTPPFASLA